MNVCGDPVNIPVTIIVEVTLAAVSHATLRLAPGVFSTNARLVEDVMCTRGLTPVIAARTVTQRKNWRGRITMRCRAVMVTSVPEMTNV